MIEGGAVDWAAHINATGILIEEQLDFEDAVAATLDWLRQRDRPGDPGRDRTAPLSGAGHVKRRVWCVPPQLSPMSPE
nr:hypothetical protein [Thioalkalivibrio sp.]